MRALITVSLQRDAAASALPLEVRKTLSYPSYSTPVLSQLREVTCARMQAQTRSITTICINCICICAHNVAKIPLAKLPYRSYLRSRLLSRVSVFKRDALMCTCVRDNVATANSHLRATRRCISPRKSLRIARIMTPHFAASGRAS